mmetsp:Transcript_153449/g.270806  ORF Transcript_153449/g.270806 Transcript_153449/m.270806 type:complete len:205 (+) Transcript_153449:233-847(+)
MAGTARSDVPVSTTPLQPLSQSETTSSSTRTRLILIVQCPCSGSTTEFHERSSIKLSSSQPPNVISLSSVRCSARNTAKVCGVSPQVFLEFATTLRKLNSGACESPSSPSPRTPSNWKALNGSSDICVAAISLSFTQPSASSSPSAAEALDRRASELLACCPKAGSWAPPMQTTSSINTPVTSPVPNDTVIWSRGCPGKTWVPS